jgi:hypothetical protein
VWVFDQSNPLGCADRVSRGKCFSDCLRKVLLCSVLTQRSAGVGTMTPLCMSEFGRSHAGLSKRLRRVLSAAFHNLSIKTTCEAIPQPSLLTLGPAYTITVISVSQPSPLLMGKTHKLGNFEGEKPRHLCFITFQGATHSSRLSSTFTAHRLPHQSVWPSPMRTLPANKWRQLPVQPGPSPVANVRYCCTSTTV